MKTILITGASNGIGAAAAKTLSKQGHTVVIIGRSPEKTKAIAEELNTPYYIADFANLRQVRELASKLKQDYSTIDVLVNNAGGIMGKRTVTVDGYEKTFQVNHLAAFLLTKELLPTLIKSKAKIIQTSSIAAKRYAQFDINDLQNEQHYTPERAYGDSKLANILFTKELHTRYAEQGIKTAAFHPGIVGTSFANDTTHIMRFLYHTPIIKKLLTITPDKGAETLLWLINTDEWQSGEYYEKCLAVRSNQLAYNNDIAQELWEKSISYVS